MDDKKSFIMYDSWATLLFNLPIEQAGQLIKAICSFQLNKEYEVKDPAVTAMYSMIKPQMVKDIESYEEVKKQRSEYGKMGAQKRWNKAESVKQDSQAMAKDSYHIANDGYPMAKDSQAIKPDGKRWQKMAVYDSVSVSDYVSPNGDKEKTGKKESQLDDSDPPGNGITISAKPWNEFWSLYGKYKKAGERFAMLAFNNAAITTDPEEIISGLKKVIDLQWSRYPKSKLQFIPKAENWLKGECWKDDVKPYEPSGGERVKLKLPAWAEDDKPEESKPASKKQLEEIKQLQKQMQEMTCNVSKPEQC